MPLPLGHAAIGLAVYEAGTHASAFERWKCFLWIVMLANLPDLDVLVGLILEWNGQAYHRGVTHSLVFAAAAALAASWAGKQWKAAPQIGFHTCFFIVLSHIAADAFLTSSPVSFWWPLEINHSAGQAGWMDVVHTVLFGGLQDAGILLVCALVLLGRRLLPLGRRVKRIQRRAGQRPPA